MMVMGDKALACLRMALLPASDPERRRLYHEACAKWSEKAVNRKFEDLAAKGYINYGVSASGGWLEDKGRMALGSDI